MRTQVEQERSAKPARRKRWRALSLFLATLLAVGAGAVYLMEWLKGVRGAELLEFTALYLCFPLGLSLLLLFTGLRQSER